MTNSVDDFMAGSGGYPYTKIDEVGGKLVFDLIEARLVDERDYDTGQVATWDNGEPKKQLVLDVNIDWDKSTGVVTGKDGVKEPVGSYYCKYTAFLALKKACDEAGIKMSQVGRGAIKRTEDGTPRNPRHAPPHQFVAQVSARAASSDVDDLLADTTSDGPAAEELI